ncbi:MAG: HAD family phosphatase [Anaerolineae bacterium]|nr:HAD family phosphatase [Anaerolineae bacterium]
MPLGAVIFDMDGLLLDTERLARQAWQQALADWGYSLPDALFLAVVGRTARSTAEVFRQGFGPDLPLDQVIRRKDEYLDALYAQAIPVQPGVFELLACLDEWGVPKAVASSTVRARVLFKLGRTGLLDRFPVVVGGDEVAHGKPAPDVFLTAAQRLDVAAAACLVLEDSDAGVTAAVAAGMRVIMVPDIKPPAPESAARAYRVVASLHHVIPLLTELRAECTPLLPPHAGGMGG